jgi:hypothetical protein
MEGQPLSEEYPLVAPEPPRENEVKLGANADLLPDPEAPVIELGDRIRILGGRLDKTTGRVVLRTETEIHLMPDGLSDRILKFEISDEGFDPDLEIEAVDILQKRKKPSLVEILDLKVDQVLETFDEDGNPAGSFNVVAVDPEVDQITIENPEIGTQVVNFAFRGVEEGLPFRVVRGRTRPEVPLALVPGEEGEGAPENNGEEGEGAGEEFADFTFLDDELEEEAPGEEDDTVERLVEIPSSEVIYSDIRQKSEAYTDLLSLRTAAAQQLTRVQRDTRVLVEMFFKLRSAILRTSVDGMPLGIKPTSIATLVDALEKRLVLLSRCVVDVQKVLYHDSNPERESQVNESTDEHIYPPPRDTENLSFRYQEETVGSNNLMLEEATDYEGRKFLEWINSYLARYNSTWRPKGEAQKISFQRDEEAFRLTHPDGEGVIPGYSRGLPEKKGVVYSENVSEVGLSMVRGLKALRAKGQIVQLGEEAAVLSYVLFPIAFAEYLTTTPMESLAYDVEAGFKFFKSMKELMSDVGGEVSEIPVVDKPFVVSVDGGTLGNIPLREYIKQLNLKMEGVGDAWPIQVLLGLQEREWTIDQQNAILESIKATQDRIVAQIIKQREELAAIAAQPPATQGLQMVPEGSAMIEKLEGEPAIKEIQETLKAQMPAYKDSDVAMVGLLLRHHPEISMAQLADQPAALSKARTETVRRQFIESLKIRQLEKERKAFAGQAPEKNRCPHVSALVKCRKISDDNNRFQALSKALATFQGEKKDNWINCNVCSKHFMCMHEVLQIYQFLRPGDAATLNREINLNFGGGQFQGYYICRVCGQPIQEIEYDNHLEFDDEGRPMSGSAVIEDKDKLQQEEITSILSGLNVLEDEQPEFDNQTKALIYRTTKQVADKLYAPLLRDHLLMITQRVFGVLTQIPSRERFIALKKAARNRRSEGEIAQDYDIYINQALVCAVAAHTLLAIQTAKPDLLLRGTPMGCRNLGGQPLEDEGTQGIQCVVNILSSFQKDSPPWSLTQFQRIPDDIARQKQIMTVFEPILKQALQDPTIQQALAQKRDYRRKVLGAMAGQGRPDENLPANFHPVPYEQKPEDYVERVIIPEAASMEDRAELWVRQGNFVAKKEKLDMPLSYSETSCCLTPLEAMDEFWKREEIRNALPELPPRIGVPPPPKFSKTEPTMTPAPLVQLLPDAPEEAYYQLFLRVCASGEKLGQAHEFGLTHKCIWCGLALPEEAELLTAAAAQAAIEGQGIEISKETFEELLDATGKANTFKTRFALEAPGPMDTWMTLMAVEPAPVEDYRDVLARTQANLAALPPGARPDEIALALGDFSNLVLATESKLKARLPPSQHANLDKIAEEGAGAVVRFLQSYVLVPVHTIMKAKGFVSTTRGVPKKWKLAPEHLTDIQTFMMSHYSHLAKYNKAMETATPWLKAKIQTLVRQTKVLLDKLKSLRPIQLPGGEPTFGYFVKFCLYAPLANFSDPNVLPLPLEDGIEAPASQVEEQAMFPARFVSAAIKQFLDEGFRYTPEQIRELLKVRQQKEEDGMLQRMTKMSRAEKEVYLLNMRLGTGEFAHTAAEIYRYDAGRYAKDRSQRMQAGIVDFPGDGAEAYDPFAGRPVGPGGMLGGGGGGYIDAGDLARINGFDDE